MEFHHHPDGLIFLRGEIVYMAPLSAFLADLATVGLPPYEGLADGYTERRYTTARHLVIGPLGAEDAPAPGEAYEAYLASIAALLAAQQDRLSPAVVPTAAMVKAEARRRIEASGLPWLVEREVSGGTVIPQEIKDYAAAVRTASNEIETMDPIPDDYVDDSHWPEALE